jgi:hypothetical protein
LLLEPYLFLIINAIGSRSDVSLKHFAAPARRTARERSRLTLSLARARSGPVVSHPPERIHESAA